MGLNKLFLILGIFLIGLASASININITSPNQTFNYGGLGNNLNLNYSIVSSNQLSYCWYNYNGTNTSLFGDGNQILGQDLGESSVTGTTTYTLVKTITLLSNSYVNNVTAEIKGSSSGFNTFANVTFLYNDSTTASSEQVESNTANPTVYVQHNWNNPQPTKVVNQIKFYIHPHNSGYVAYLQNAYVNGYRNLYCLNNTNLNISFVSTNQKNLTLYSNDTAGNLASELVSWDYKVFENSRTSNSTTYETSYENYKINVTANSSLTGVSLLFNGTTYAMSNLGSGIWSYSRDLPTSAVGNNSINYRFTYSGETINSDYLTYQNILPIIFTLCNGTYTTKFLNISFKDENDLSSINASIPASIFEYYLGDGSITKNYTYSNSTENQYYTFCASPTDKIFHVNPYVQYKQGTEYPQRIWDAGVTDFTNTTTNKILYLLNSADGIYVTFQIINTADQVLSGVISTAVRTIAGESVTVAQGTTGASGTVTFWLNPDFEHLFSFSKSGFTTYSYSDTPTQTSYTITLGGTSNATNSSFRGITYSIIPTNNFLVNDTSYNFGFNLTSGYYDVSEYGFNLRLSNGTIISGSYTGTEGTQLILNYNVNNQSIIYLDAYWVTGGQYTNITKYWIIQNSNNTSWSIKTFFTDLVLYLDSGIFGLDDFGRILIAFIVIFISSGIVSYKYGLTSPLAVTTLIFGIIFFLDVIVGFIPHVRGIAHLPTYLSGLILAIIILREAQS